MNSFVLIKSIEILEIRFSVPKPDFIAELNL